MANEEPEARSTSRGLGGALDALVPALGALVTGVGLLAFVALFGGAILWDRADQAGLPGAEAVALMPRSALLATGAHFLVGALLLSVAAVVALWIFDEIVLRSPEQIAAEATQAATARARGGLATPNAAESPMSEAERALAEAIRGEEQAQAKVDAAHQATEAASKEGDARVLDLKTQELMLYVDDRNKKLVEVRQTQESLTREIIDKEEDRALVKRSLILGLLLFCGEIVFVVMFHPSFGIAYWLLLAAVSAATSVLAVAVYQSTKRFTWFAVAAFLAVAIFQGVATHIAITSDPMVEPAALLLGGQPPVKGIFVTQTDDRVYLGMPVGIGDAATLVAFPRERVSGLAIGRLTPAGDEADAVADKLVEILCSHAPIPTTSDERRASPRCRAGDAR